MTTSRNSMRQTMIWDDKFTKFYKTNNDIRWHNHEIHYDKQWYVMAKFYKTNNDTRWQHHEIL